MTPYFTRSLGKAYAVLERPRIAFRLLLLILALHTALLMYSAHAHSPTRNEPAHLVAGLSHWSLCRFELYRVNPPLVRMVAALPVMAAGYQQDWTNFHEYRGARPVFGLGEDFLAANGEQSFFFFTLARWACVPFSLLGAVVCYLWARDLYGFPSALMAATLWCFSPNVLAHASLITADVGGASLGIAACYTFWRWLRSPVLQKATMTGIVLGIAQLGKTTLLLLYPLWVLLWIAYRASTSPRMHVRGWAKEGGMLLLQFAISFYVINLGYGFENFGKPLGEFEFVSNLFTGNGDTAVRPYKSSEPPAQTRATSNISANRFSSCWLGSVPVPFPKNYVLGIDIQKKDFEKAGRQSYLRGELRKRGWWYYYLYAIVVKVPLGTWILGAVLLALRSIGQLPSHEWRSEVALSIPPLAIFAAVSYQTGISRHMRYVLPCFPFVFVLLSQLAQRLAVLRPCAHRPAKSLPPVSFFANWSVFATCVAFLWTLTSSLVVYPHSLSYFNEAAGGPSQGAKHLLNSNIDWGQDLLYLRRWREDRQNELNEVPFHLAYCGEYAHGVLGHTDMSPWPKEYQEVGIQNAGQPTNHLLELRPGVYAISVNLLYGFRAIAHDGRGVKFHLGQSILKKFRSLKPYGRAGYSILIFRVTD